MSDRVDFTEKGTLDEIVSSRGAHLECMGGSRWFLSFQHADGTETAVWFSSRELRKPFWEKREPRKGAARMADEIVAQLRNPDFAGAYQHLRGHAEIDRLFHAAADRIESLSADLEQSRSVEETTHGLYRFWNAKAAELAAQLDEVRTAGDKESRE